ncbi:MAG: hypothetical protein F6K25_12930 [Okeania sp. SIO2G4]|uniref:hypothetical protein n=1 Tax=unclassified Okeania TaxID=2634635 RepID=UPI0013B76E9D|nr:MULTISPECIES: hypothetical protein [unclassified Okeania]NEP38517.1 hypothetical protein [Okeania sp. SIO2H7]NEP74847.1 hypothetical protein [Okeania sp. SIO2G5]NEP95954.1 hypothetical protein [Okeania sp. SIO2F5]NEQ91553.1 hypothetical protein [Okeania sp. SIO2G4]
MDREKEAIALPKRTQKFRTRLFPGKTLPSQEIARRKAIKAEFSDRCRTVFEKLRPQLIDKYYNHFIAVDPDSEEYIIDSSLENLIQKVRSCYPDGKVKVAIYRLNETGACGRI